MPLSYTLFKEYIKSERERITHEKCLLIDDLPEIECKAEIHS